MKKINDYYIVLTVLLLLVTMMVIGCGLVLEEPKVDDNKTDINEETNSSSIYGELKGNKDINEVKRDLIWKSDYPKCDSYRSLEENASLRSSYEETIDRYAQARECVVDSNVDFSNIKITVLGDSLTEGIGLEEDEKDEFNWPSQLKEILGCKDVINMGISGSTVENLKGHAPMCERWEEIDYDNDIIIVMGGTNDCLNQEYYEFGSVGEKAENTFCGDLSAMLKGIKERYQTEEHYCKLIFINPPLSGISAAYQDMRPNEFRKQKEYADVINEIATSEGFEVIDMYNNNILNSADKETYDKLYNIDGLHFNKEGYTIMAYYVASQIISRVE